MRRLRTPPRISLRPMDAHKASVGRVLVVGGSRDMRGAPALTGLGALRAGAGLVRIAVPRSIQGDVAVMLPEATTAGLAEGRKGSLSLAARESIEALLPAWDALVLGPGLGRTDGARKLVRKLARTTSQPTVVDADGLFALGTKLDRLRDREAPLVLTPHEGEAARLLGGSSAEVRADRERAALAIAEASGAVVVLKGPGTLVTDGARCFLCRKGGPHLASGGTGDVLAGVIAAFLAGLPATGGEPFAATCAAVYAHALAGDLSAGTLDRGILASDVADALPEAVATLVRRPRRSSKRS